MAAVMCVNICECSLHWNTHSQESKLALNSLKVKLSTNNEHSSQVLC